MAIVVQGVLKIASVAGAFLIALSAGPQPQGAPVPEQTSARVPDPVPVTKPQPPDPQPESVDAVFENFRGSFLERVASGEQTLFNACFTRAGNPVMPSSVSLIRNGAPLIRKAALQSRSVDYTLRPIVVLDPGHRSEGDPGAVRNSLRETAVVDAVALKLKSALEQRGTDVIGTRSPVADGVALTSRYRFKDQDRVLQWRAELVYELAAKFPDRPVLSVSLHTDASVSPHSGGAGVFYYAGTGAHSASSAALARNIARHYRTPAGSRVKSENFAMLRCQHKDTPSVLVELGYLTNPGDFDFLRAAVRNEGKAARIADALATGIFGFIEQKKRERAPAPQIVVAAAAAPTKIF